MPGLPIWSSTKRHLRAAPRQLDAEHERPVLHADVEGEAVLAHQLHAGDEVGLQAEGRVGLDLDQPADAAQALELLEGDEVGSRWRRPSRPAAWATMPQSRGSASAISWTKAASWRCRPLSTHTSANTSLSTVTLPRALSKSARQIGAVDLRHVLQPAIAQPLHVVEMHMAVDDRKIRHGTPPLQLIYDRWPRSREDQIVPDVRQARHAAQAHDAVELAAVDVEDMGDAGLAGHRQAPELRPADEAGRGAERQRLDHVGRRGARRRRAGPGYGPPTASTIAGSASSEAGAPSSWRPPWLETMRPSMPRSTAARASAGCSTPLRISGPFQMPAHRLDVGPGHGRDRAARPCARPAS